MYAFFCDAGLHRFHSGDFFFLICTHAHTTCQRVLSKIIPIASSAVLLLLRHVFVSFLCNPKVLHSIYFHSTPSFPLSWKAAVIWWWKARNYCNKQNTVKKAHIVYCQKQFALFLVCENCGRVTVAWIHLG